MASLFWVRSSVAVLVCIAAACDRKPAEASARDADLPPEIFTGTTCPLVGCMPGVDLDVHLAATPAVLARIGSFHACHQRQCWDGTFVAPPFAGGLAGCTTGSKPGPRCALRPDGDGAILTLHLAADDAVRAGARGFVDGDSMLLRIDAGGTTLLDVSRAIRYVDEYPNGRQCPPRCRRVSLALTSDVKPPAPSSP